MDHYAQPVPAAALDADARGTFIAKTYSHLFTAIIAFCGIETFLMKSGIAHQIAAPMMKNWLFVIGGFVVVNWLASRAAFMAQSKAAQYGALGIFIVAEALIFAPILLIASLQAPGVIPKAGIVTLIGFACLTGIVFISRKDFSFMGSMLKWGFVCALLAIVGGFFFNFELGFWFSMAMVVLAGGAILYDTSNVLHHYPEDRYVGASLQLFASVGLLFWYVLRIFMSRD